MPLVYIAQNKHNGKVYVGMTSKGFRDRWKTHLKDVKRGSNLYFHKAIRKYTVEGFEICYVTCINNKEAFETEIFLIALFKANNRDFGYNLTAGGEGHLDPSPAARAKMRESGKRLSLLPRQPVKQETKAKLSIIVKEWWKRPENQHYKEKRKAILKSLINERYEEISAKKRKAFAEYKRCRKGHELTSENTYRNTWKKKDGKVVYRKRCRICMRQHDKNRSRTRSRKRK